MHRRARTRWYENRGPLELSGFMLTFNSVNEVDDWGILRKVVASGGTGSPCFCREMGRLAHRNRRVARGGKGSRSERCNDSL